MTGAKILQLNTSPGGAPKHPVPTTHVGKLGLDGDGHRASNHGGRDRAVVLYGREQIERLQSDGHPIVPGAVGENVTTVGLDYRKLCLGDRLRLGQSVVVELTSHADPCAGIAAAFADGDFSHVFERKHPGMGRLTARVLTEGPLAPGDPIEVLPAPLRPAPGR